MNKHPYINRLVISAICCLLAVPLSAQDCLAANASEWISGNIIDDSVFINKDSMSVEQIQDFLNSKVGTGTNGTLGQCDTNGEMMSELGGGTRAEYGAAHNNPTPFTCLKDYYEVPKIEPGPGIPENNYGGKPIPSGAKSAAQLIWDAAQKYNISPKVLLVKLGTESAGPLTSDDWPFLRQYTYAMGAHCPDSGPGGSANCDTDYAGFSIQMSEAASLLRWYLDSMQESWWPYRKPYQVNSILWNIEESGCGAGDVLVGNKATAALYTYTPYQPNQAALDNMYGKGDGCSAYGNRNFWRVFNDWFGTVRDFTYLDVPRWMVLKNDTYKKDPITGENVDGILAKGTQLKFITKVWKNGAWYLRTKYDTDNHIEKLVALSDLENIQFEPIDTPRHLKLKTSTQKIYPRSEITLSNQTYSAGSTIKFSSKIVVNGKTFLRSEYDEQNGDNAAIPEDNLSEITYVPFETPRYMQIINDTTKVDPVVGTVDVTPLTKDTQTHFSSKVFVGGKYYYRTDEDTAINTPIAISSDNVRDIQYQPYGEYPKWMRLKNDSQKAVPSTGSVISGTIKSGTQLLIAQKITVNSILYYQTTFDKTANMNTAIDASNFEEIPFIDMETPRIMKLKVNAQKQYPKTGEKLPLIFNKGMEINFSTKIVINGKMYLRSVYDTNLNNELAIPFEYLQEVGSN